MIITNLLGTNMTKIMKISILMGIVFLFGFELGSYSNNVCPLENKKSHSKTDDLTPYFYGLLEEYRNVLLWDWIYKDIISTNNLKELEELKKEYKKHLLFAIHVYKTNSTEFNKKYSIPGVVPFQCADEAVNKIELKVK